MKKAFTLAEILICLVILGVLAVIMLRNLANQNFAEKENALKANKAINLINEASANITQLEREQVPYGGFIINTTGTWEYVVCSAPNNCNSLANNEQIRDLFGKYIKFENRTNDFFNDFSGHQEEMLLADNVTRERINNVAGAKIPGDIFIGFRVSGRDGSQSQAAATSGNTTINCYSPVRIPPTEFENGSLIPTNEIEIPETEQCWGTVYIDTNGQKGPNTLGEDLYIFGLGEMGIVK